MFKTAIRRICSISALLIPVLIIIRGNALKFSYFSLFKSSDAAFKITFSSFYDIVFIIGLSITVAAIAYILRGKPGFLKIILFAYTGLAVLLILIALINVKNVYMMGGPFNYQWLYYSDYLENSDSKKAIAANFTSRLIIDFLAFSLLVILGSLFLNTLIKKYSLFDRYRKLAIFSSLCIVLIYLSTSKYYLYHSDLSYQKMANPVVAFMESVYVTISNEKPDLFTMDIPEDFEPFAKPNLAQQTNFTHQKSKIDNVLLFVMESVPAEYVAGYPGKIKATPVIEKNLRRSMIFSDIYAHVPATNSSLVSILSSLYPMISYKSLTNEHPDFDWPDLSSTLKSHNYNTAFLHASDNRFQKVDSFLLNRQFNEVHDFRSMPCEKETFIGSTEKWEHLDGVDEECMGAAFIGWLDNLQNEKPFFATLWSMQTHYPYFTSGIEKDYKVGDSNLNRYLNALNHTDSVLGLIINNLEERNLMESTLIVLVGDHGEAFGQHDQYGHAVHIYEENIKVPLIFINPVLFNNDKKDIVGGHIDIAPTITELLQIPSPKEWQGQSLLDPNHPNRAFFFNPYRSYLFGYRTSEYKVILDAIQNDMMIFNIKEDPQETENIAPTMPELADISQKRLGHWIQNHSAVINERLNK